MVRLNRWLDNDRNFDLMMRGVIAAVLLACFIGGPWAMAALAAQRYTRDLDQCVRVFDYTRDQCDLMLRYHVKPYRPTPTGSHTR